jgi:hypothetical protein
MQVETPTTFFSQVIQDHLELKQRNRQLESHMPLDRYLNEDPFDNHPLFKMDGVPAIVDLAEPVLAWPGEDTVEHSGPELEDSGLWGRSRDFDWGD